MGLGLSLNLTVMVSILDGLRIIDLFGRHVNLRFKNADLFKTHCGGCATILLGMIMGLLFVMRARTRNISRDG